MYILTYKGNKFCNTMSSFRQRVIGLKAGEDLKVPMDQKSYATVRSYASELGIQMGRKYTTKRDREARVYIITRTI